MLTKKAALVKAGFVEGDRVWSPGDENVRGRLSKAANAECERLVREEGYDIEGFKSSQTGTVDRVAVVSGVKTIADIGWPTRDETVLRAMCGTVDVGMRKVCNICHGSLTYCPCESPRVWVDYDREAVVTFLPKTG